MNDKAMYKLIEDFANDLSVCKGGNIKVVVTPYTKSFQPSRTISADFYSGFRYEDSNYVSDMISGAEALLNYLERNKYKIVKGKKK